jgi:putative ABC transport system ATP-binding protein
MLAISDAKKTFQPGTPNERVALDGLSLFMQDGEFMSIIGSNGAGKSTLFGAVTGAFLLDSGTITIDKRDITWMPPHKRAFFIGHIFQDPTKGTAPNMTIEENLALAYSRKKGWALRPGVSKEDAGYFRERLASLEMGLEDRMKTNVGLLSGGQRQALALLMSTIGNPGLLLLDEHTAALDPSAAEHVMQITVDVVRSQKITTIMITHNISQALRFGTRTVMMGGGRVTLDISGEDRRRMTAAKLIEMYSQ